MVYYVRAHHPDLVLLSRERKYSSLACLFEDAREVEENIRASKRIRDQVCSKNLHAYFQSKMDLESSWKHGCSLQFLGHLRISMLRMKTSFLTGEGKALNVEP